MVKLNLREQETMADWSTGLQSTHTTKGEASKDFSKFKECEGETRVSVSVSLGFAEAVPSRLLSTIHIRLEVPPTRRVE